MTERPVDRNPIARPPHRSPGRIAATALRRFGSSVALLPRSAVCAVRLATGGPVPAGMTRRGALGHALVGMLLGVVGLVELGLIGLFVARGIGYGFVDGGPYTDAWGGPTLAGAWIVHFLVGLGIAFAAVLAGCVVMALYRHITDRFRGRPAPGWTIPTTVAVCAGVALFVIAWTRQL